MTAVLKSALHGYWYMNTYLSDPRTENYPLSSLWFPVSMVVLYFIFIKKIGPDLMENRKPYNIKNILIAYNFFQIVLNGYLCFKGLTIKWGRKNVNWQCEPMDYSSSPSALEMLDLVWAYYVLKIIDLLDTVFFVLRKKHHNVSFLHLYHHSMMVLGGWVGFKFFGSGHVTFIGLINCFVHAIMYTYYLITILNPETRKNVWWKKHITQLQLLQFFIIFIHNGQVLFQTNCNVPMFVPMVITPQYFFFTFLFWDFYKKAYLKKENNQEKLK